MYTFTDLYGLTLDFQVVKVTMVTFVYMEYFAVSFYLSFWWTKMIIYEAFSYK